MNLKNSLLESLLLHKDKIALEIDDKTFSYEELDRDSSTLANSLLENKGERVLIFCFRSYLTYVSILACIKANLTFIPLNPKFKKERLKLMIQNAKATKIVVDESCKELFLELQNELKLELEVFSTIKKSSTNNLYKVAQNEVAYILFTSGSTGIPKGVQVSRDNLFAYISKMQKLLKITPQDRISNFFDITFDVAMHDIFCTLLSGAKLCVIPADSLINPIKFIQQKELTIFYAVPSLIKFLSKLKALKEEALPSLRLSMFCGEALSLKNAQAWATCANRSKVYNLYGPTETTIVATQYLCYKFGKPCNEALNEEGIPLGFPLENLEISLRDENGKEVENGEMGEIWISGDQVALGYLDDEPKTNEKFIHINNKNYYKTGDIGIKKQIGNELLYCYCGRIDDQVKIQGYRIELLEVDLKLSKITNLPSIAVVITENGINKLIGVIEAIEINQAEILAKCKEEMPNFMIPSKFVTLERFPINANGKIDRNKIKEEILCKN
ncbi:AMP-binding protein [Helicobacter ibis]|uniref:AMP-binding protein n=1 Tax=Helicobacter ibis TaxID=2962633 RepID=A0ABT4VFS9_9HELI|nr:AMP-binding protein [Helicobacter ibis]MDA3969554.1 AMP-binding protein [Helicobacter ibis]